MSTTPDPGKPSFPWPDIIIISHAILTGAAIMVPIPFADDFIVFSVRQNLVKALAKHHKAPITPAEMYVLANLEESEGCLRGVVSVLRYPFKIIREFFKLLEIQKSVETATHTYYFGILIDEVFRNGWYAREKLHPIRKAIIQTKKDANKELVKEIFSSTLALNKENYALLIEWSRKSLEYQVSSSRARLLGWFRKARLIKKAVEENPDSLFEHQPPQVAELAGQIYENLNKKLLGKPQQRLREMLEQMEISVKPVTSQNQRA